MKLNLTSTSAPDPSSSMRLTRIGYKNFKAFRQLDIDIRPITVLLGPNNSGKSSVLAGPKLLTQTTESFDRSVSLLLNGIFGDYGTFRDIVHGNRRTDPIEITMTLRHPRSNMFSADKETQRRGSHAVSVLRLCFRYKLRLKQIVLSEVELSTNGKSLLKASYSSAAEEHIISSIGGVAIPPRLRASLSRRMRLQHFVPQPPGFVMLSPKLQSVVGSRGENRLRDLRRASTAFYRFFEDLEYVGAIRAAPARTFLFSGETRSRVGANGENAINIMVMDGLRPAKKSIGIHKKVVHWLKKAGIARGLRISPLSDRHYEIHVGHSVTKEYSNFADVGYGNSQIIPVLVAGYNLRRGETLVVEQPEIHLHPRAQAELGEFFSDLYRGGVQSLVETHSEHLVLRLQHEVASGRIRPNDIAFYYVHAKGVVKRAVRMTLDAEGRFTGDWPEGFFTERLEEARKLARARLDTR